MPKWFIASIIAGESDSGRQPPSRGQVEVRDYRWLFRAPNSDLAYSRLIRDGVVNLARVVDSTLWGFLGVSDLLGLMEDPADGVEILWTDAEMGASELAQVIPSREQLFGVALSGQPDAGPGSGWYVGKLLFEEVHEVGGHGATSLVWIQWHLVSSETLAGAYEKAVGLGEFQGSSDIDHKCDGERASWRFVGVSSLLPLIEPPSDGAMLYFETRSVSFNDVRSLIPPRVDLAVFRSSGV